MTQPTRSPKSGFPTWPRPRIVVSACLGFAPVRYSGETIPDRFVAALRDHVTFLAVCPEVEIGLGVPRPTVRLVRQGEETRMLQPKTGHDVTEKMQRFAQTFISQLGQVEGFIFKNRSPSCAIKDAKVYTQMEAGAMIARGPGLFAKAVMETFPLLPKEDEGRLTNARLRSHFLTRVFALARLRQLADLESLMTFHARYKLLLLAHHQEETRFMGRLLAQAKARDFPNLRPVYEERFLHALRFPFRVPAMANALLHAFGYFKEYLSSREKAHFLDALAEFQEEKLPLEALLTLLRSWTLRYGEAYLESQALFEPYPRALMDLTTS
ncbi:MAG: YbgA family protein [Thermoanaerobaculum sp.]